MHQKPFHLALTLSAVFLGAYVLLGFLTNMVSLEPGIKVGGLSRWCERVSDGIFREPVNALSNLGFMFAGLCMFFVLTKDGEKPQHSNQFHGLTPIAKLYAGAALFLGPGSMLMHGTHTYWGQWIDNVSMVIYITLPWLINVSVMGRWSEQQFFKTYTLVIVSFAGLSWFFGSSLGIGFDLFGTSIALWIISEILFRFWSPGFRWVSGFIGFIVAAVFGILPQEIFTNPIEYWWIVLFWLPAALSPNHPMKKRNYSPWFFMGMFSYMSAFIIWLQGVPDTPYCQPDSLIQPHGIWHILSAFSTWCFFKFLRTEKNI